MMQPFLMRTMFAVTLALGLANPLRAIDFTAYPTTPSSQFNFPTIADPADQGPVVFDNLSDGRLLAVSTEITDAVNFLGTPKVYLESAPGSRNFQLLGNLPLMGGVWSSGGGAFLRVSQGNSGGVRIAVGNNDFGSPLVGVFTEVDLLGMGVGTMPIDWFPVAHFSGAWRDDRHLAITSGTFGNPSDVNLLDTNSTPGMEIMPLAITGIEGASGGVGFDSAGSLYTANGFENGNGSATGLMKRFSSAEIDTAIAGMPLDFEADGVNIDTILSGGSLVFDREDSMLVGGSNFFGGGQADFFSLVPGPGLGMVNRTFDPDTLATSFYSLTYNEVLHEFYAIQPFALDFPSNIDNTLAFVFSAEAPAGVPEPASLALVGFGVLLISRRRRRRRRMVQ